MTISIYDYKAVFFDAGDTLLTIPGAHERMHRFLAERAFHHSKERIAELFHAAFRRFYYGKPVTGTERCSPESDRAFWIGLYRHLITELSNGAELEEEIVHRWCHELYDLFTDPEVYVLFDDVVETMDVLRRKGFRLGIVSNFAPTLRRILEHKGILSYFDPVIVSTEVGLEKPNPDIFRLALEQAGLQPGEMLYVGDHDKNDIWAPNQVGIAAVKIKRYDYHTGEGIHSLRELWA